MNRRAFLGTAGLGAVAVFVPGVARRAFAIPSTSPKEIVEEGGPALELYRELGVDGAFVLCDARSGTSRIVHREIAQKGFLPASTFKIPNTLIGLESGVIPDATFALKWNGVWSDFVDSWNRDHDLDSAMANSVLWYYQEVARRVGLERYRRDLERFAYGNRNPGDEVDRFWVEGEDLRITPYEQVDFLSRLVQGKLPVAPRNIEILRGIMPHAEANGVILRAKTGLTEQVPHKVGWLVGWTEDAATAEPLHVFASLVLGPAAHSWRESPTFRARSEMGVRLLAHFGAVPPEMGRPH